MNIHYDRIKNKIEKELEPSYLRLIDNSADHSDHYNKPDNDVISHLTVVISSKKFSGLKKISCHQMVNNKLKDEFDSGLHALQIKIVEETN